MKVLCIATYELGQQPLGAAGPAAALLAAGHEVAAADLSVESWPGDRLAWAEALVFSVPMHTATELALAAARRCRDELGRKPLAFLGLYAGVAGKDPLVQPGDLLAVGETAGPLLAWLERLSGAEPAPPEAPEAVRQLGPVTLPVTAPPARHLLPPLERYARYRAGGPDRLVAALEASRGCNHSCRHCPVAPVYQGRSRAVPLESITEDLDRVVAAGAEHVSFADPDFLNRPRHALAVAEALHERHPALTFDATIKVEHLLRHRALLAPLAAAGLVFVVSAFESTDDAVLSLLDKGHRAADEEAAIALCRAAGIEIRPSWLPFSPWTTLGSLASLLELAARGDLVASTDPVQYSIRLLLPAGSLLAENPDPVLEEALRAAEALPGTGSLPWRHAEPAIDELQAVLAGIVEQDAAGGQSAAETFGRIWSACAAAGAPLPAAPPGPAPELASPLAAGERPRLSEAWFCCAEPTARQLEAVGS